MNKFETKQSSWQEARVHAECSAFEGDASSLFHSAVFLPASWTSPLTPLNAMLLVELMPG